jgi:hypothetical protein
MLRVTVSLWPCGDESRQRELLHADIGNVGGGASANYCVALVDETGERRDARLDDYPRWSASLWDLVIRAAARAAYGEEALPARPVPISERVPVHQTANGLNYVRVRDIPEPVRSVFCERMANSTRPLVDEDPDPFDCVYAWDWHSFLEGSR